MLNEEKLKIFFPRDLASDGSGWVEKGKRERMLQQKRENCCDDRSKGIDETKSNT